MSDTSKSFRLRLRYVLLATAIIVTLDWLSNRNEAKNAQALTTEVSSELASNHRCTWCDKEYTGSGYMHVGNDCITTAGGFEKINAKCSIKCCMESWNSKHGYSR